MMAILGFGDYLCEACRHFDTDGDDGNHPSCRMQHGGFGDSDEAIPLGRECPYGYEFGMPSGYPVNMESNKRRAYEVKALLEVGEVDG